MNYRTWMCIVMGLALLGGCGSDKKQYGQEEPLALENGRRLVWAVAPAIDLSGQRGVDPLLQADLLYAQLQQVRGLTVIPVNRVAEVMAALRLGTVQSAEQAALVCDILGCDGLVIASITAFDPFNPPKLGASVQVFGKPNNYRRQENLDVRDLARQAAPKPGDVAAPPEKFIQAVGMYDAANGSVRQQVEQYAAGRNDPTGPLAAREYFLSMDRYCGFVYHQLVGQLLGKTSGL